MLGLGGLLARVYFGDALYADGANPNQAFAAYCLLSCSPRGSAALIGVGVLSAVMSTADGWWCLPRKSSPTIFICRTLAPKMHPNLSQQELDGPGAEHQSLVDCWGLADLCCDGLVVDGR
jgi:hypothetical protein